MSAFQPGVEGRDPAIFRSFEIDGQITTDTTHRTRIIEFFTEVKGRTFLDIGGADGYEGRALSARGAASAVTLEGKESLYQHALKAAKLFSHPNHAVIRGDARVIDELGLGRFDVVCCFGLLYHMSNPFNLLKRIAHVADDLLLLETHVAPEGWAEGLLLPKHRGTLMRGMRTLYLDSQRFEGRICMHRGDQSHSKGSLEQRWTFWLSQASLVKALTRSGFEILYWHHEPDPCTPQVLGTFGSRLGFGHANTKVFVVARVCKQVRSDVGPGTISDNPTVVTEPQLAESMLDRALFAQGRLVRKLTGR